MAIPPRGDKTTTLLGKHNKPSRPTSLAETIQIYREDVPPPTPLKDAKYRKVSQHTSPADSVATFKTYNMHQSAELSECQQKIDLYRRDSVLDPPFFYNFESTVEEGIFLSTDFDRGSDDTLLESYCSTSSSQSTTSPRQSLLPPLPQLLPSSCRPRLVRQSRYSPLPASLLAAPLEVQCVRKSACESPSKRSINLQQLEQLRQSPLLQAEFRRSRTPSPKTEPTWGSGHPVAPSFNSAVNNTTSCGSHSMMPSFTTSDGRSQIVTAGSIIPTPAMNDPAIGKRSKSRRPANLDRPENITSIVHGRCISLPLKTKSTSPIGADFNLGLPSHEFESRRQSPAIPTIDGGAPSPLLTSPSSTALGTPTTPSSTRALLPPFHERPDEISAFDSDTDDERPSQSVKIIRKKLSRPFDKARPRAETVPTANHRNISKGSSLTTRVSKQDIKTPGLRFSDVSDAAPATEESGIMTGRTSKPSTTSGLVTNPSATANPPIALRKKTSSRESPSNRTSSASKTSKRSGASSPVLASPRTTGGVSAAGSRSKNPFSSGRRLGTWIARVLGRRNTQ